jgi:hypothetical protein
MSGELLLPKYREDLADRVRIPFLLARRFVAAEGWTKAAIDGGLQYLGLFREQEPDLSAILAHERVLILGEPGAGKSTITKAAAQHLLDTGGEQNVPVFTSLKSYNGNLRTLLTQHAPAAILDAPELNRTYLLDGVDEVPAAHRSTLQRELKALLTNDAHARFFLTSRQAFHAQHPDAFLQGLPTYHLLGFNDEDIRAYATQKGVEAKPFLAAVREVECEEEIHNPFVLDVMLERYHDQGRLSPLRSDNVGYVIERLILSRPTVNSTRQRRALRMLAVACETAARNELTEDEALQVLQEAIELPRATALQVLEELSLSILIGPSGGISFQMRSYGEYLAASELSAAAIDRVKELAFAGTQPIDSWLNTITYLAEMNHKVKEYFIYHHPQWLINVSPAAFTDEERTELTTRLLQELNQSQVYIVDHKVVPARKLARLLTPVTINDLRTQLTSTEPHAIANAMVLLSLREPVPATALPIATDNQRNDPLRYSAIVSLMNGGNNTMIDDLIRCANTEDDLHINVIDRIGSLSTPTDLPRVLPLLASTNAMLSATYYHFRELNTKAALTATIDYLRSHPEHLDGHRIDAYLSPIIDLIPTFWENDLGSALGNLLAGVERAQIYPQNSELVKGIIQAVAAHDHDGITIQSLIASLANDRARLRILAPFVASLINLPAAQWIKDNAPAYKPDLAPWLPDGQVRDFLAPHSPEFLQGRAAAHAEYAAQERERQEELRTTKAEHQNTIRTATDINAVINACERLAIEHWPEISPEQRAWLTQHVTDTLIGFDLAHSITWQAEHTWTHPRGLKPLLNLTDYYNLQLTTDVPIVLALRSWTDKAISNYYRREGLTPAAQEQLTSLLRGTENDNITSHVLSFLRETGYDAPPIREALTHIALDTARSSGLRRESIERLASVDTATGTLLILATDRDPAIRDHAFRHLVRQQHQATIRPALARLTDDDLRAAEVPFPRDSPIDWIGTITALFAWEDLRHLWQRALTLELWRVTSLITATMATMDKRRTASTIRQQLPTTPPPWQQHLRQEADTLERTARIETAQRTPFDVIIRKLKGATSMIRIKVWCEGSTDRPIFRKLFNELGETEIAQTIAFVSGWSNLLAETQPERWLDGCRRAAIIMDGDRGRQLNKKKRPLTNQAKELQQRFANHPIKLHVLQRYGIENYVPRYAYETVLQRDLSEYFPLPDAKKIEDHFCEPQRFWQRWLNRLRKRNPSFYRKKLNEQVAEHIMMTDLKDTDLATIIHEIKQAAEESRHY